MTNINIKILRTISFALREFGHMDGILDTLVQNLIEKEQSKLMKIWQETKAITQES